MQNLESRETEISKQNTPCEAFSSLKCTHVLEQCFQRLTNTFVRYKRLAFFIDVFSNHMLFAAVRDFSLCSS